MLGKNKAKGLSIIIVGCGRVGTTLVEQLSAEGHDITIVDKDRDVVMQESKQPTLSLQLRRATS